MLAHARSRNYFWPIPKRRNRPCQDEIHESHSRGGEYRCIASTSDSTVSSSSPSAPLVLPQRPTSTPFPQVPPDLVGDDGETSAVKGRVSISRRIQDPSKRRVPFHQIPTGGNSCLCTGFEFQIILSAMYKFGSFSWRFCLVIDPV
jgi:hypothetical protein